MKKTKAKYKYSLLQRISIGACLLVCILSLIIIIFAIVTAQQVTANEISFNKEYKQENVVEEWSFATEVPIIEETTSETENYDDMTVPETTEPQKTPVIEKVEENLSEWCLANESKDYISLWKITDQTGNLFIALKKEEEVIATFKYEGIKTDIYDEWVLCNEFLEEITISEIVDCSFTAYHEVGGKNPENVQALISVLLNRAVLIDRAMLVNCYGNEVFPNSIRGVITQNGQFACSKNVVHRVMKGGSNPSFLEEIDLESCFREALLLLAGENIQEVPTDVVFAAITPLGEIWKVIEGTYYCYL